MARVLVIEDNPVNMRLAVLLLRQAGHIPCCAVDAETGLAMAHAEPVDLILMDFQLPGMNGAAATALLKQDPVTAAIPVIALTATIRPVNPDLGQDWTCDAFLSKPLHYPDLYAAIDRLLHARPAAGGQARRQSPAPLPPLDDAAGQRRAAVPAVDLAVLERLIGPDPGTLDEFFVEFIGNAARIRGDLLAACHDRQVSQAGRLAHALKSSALIVGAGRLGRLCAEMESAGQAGDAATLFGLLPALAQELDAVERFLRARPTLARPCANAAPATVCSRIVDAKRSEPGP